MFPVLQSVWSLSQLLNSATAGQKQPRMCKRVSAAVFQYKFLHQLKFKFHIISCVTKHLMFHLKLLKSVKTNRSSRTVKNRWQAGVLL